MKPVLASVSFPADHEVELILHNRWTVHEIEDINRLLRNIGLKNIRKVTVDGSDLEDVDLSAAWAMITFVRQLGARNVEFVRQGFSERHIRIFGIIRNIDNFPPEKHPYFTGLPDMIAHIGKASLAAAKSFVDLQASFGRFCITLLATIRHPARLRFRSLVFHVNEIGMRAIPIVALLAFLISIVLGYQGALQLDRFGANIFTVNLVSISVLREMGVVITSIIVAGRTGSAFAAKIGVMKINQEIDALQTFGLDPFDILIMPRILALLIALPALTFIADIVGLFGAMFISSQLLHISTTQFMSRLHEAVSTQTFYIGLVKAPFFALLIGMTGCQQGLEVRSSSEEVGLRTTAAVVQSIFLIILADAAFSILFYLDGRMSGPVIEVRGLVNAFGTQVVHDGIDLAVNAGEIIGIVGGSGSGKSVLLRSIVGLQRPKSGQIFVQGTDITRLRDRQLLDVQKLWGVLFQGGALFSSLTVRQNVALPLQECLGMPHRMADDLAKLKILVGLPDEASNKLPGELSGGMIKRAGLARALALDPKVLFLDEPTAGLDPISADAFDKLIFGLSRNLDLAIIMITHDLNSLYSICDRIAVLVDKKMRTGTLEELLQDGHPWVREYFHGERSNALLQRRE